MLAFVTLGLVLSCTAAPESPDEPAPLPRQDVAAAPWRGARPPRPMSGGTLLVSRFGPKAWAVDPDLGVVEVVDISVGQEAVVARVDLGDTEPGRLVEGDDGRVHVALRRGGGVATIDPTDYRVAVTPTCAAPRGLAMDGGDVIVACESGALLRVPEGREPERVAMLGRDLRDVVVDARHIAYVTRFRSAEVLAVDLASGVSYSLLAKSDARAVAWRMVAGKNGPIVLHEIEATRPLSTSSGGYGASSSQTAMVSAGVTLFDGAKPRAPISAGHMAIDVTTFVQNGVESIALAPLVADQAQLVTFTPTISSPDAGTVAPQFVGAGTPVAVASASDGRLVVQLRDPHRLVVLYSSIQPRSIPLTSRPSHAGFTLFHSLTKAGIACVGCHPEGGDDGHVWTFEQPSEAGVKTTRARTQSLHTGVVGTEPLHWEGDLATFDALVTEVYTRRMGGAAPARDAVVSLEQFVAAITPPPAPETLERDAVERGAYVFARAGCGACHSGPRLTDNLSHDVGVATPLRTPLQTPSLVGVGARAPYMRDGCAPSLEARLVDAACGGSAHGDVAGLGVAERRDLVAYLESL